MSVSVSEKWVMGVGRASVRSLGSPVVVWRRVGVEERHLALFAVGQDGW